MLEFQAAVSYLVLVLIINLGSSERTVRKWHLSAPRSQTFTATLLLSYVTNTLPKIPSKFYTFLDIATPTAKNLK